MPSRSPSPVPVSRRRSVFRLGLGLVATAWAIGVTPATSWGQPSPTAPAEGPAVVVGTGAGEPAAPSTLLGRFGVPVAKRLLFSSEAADRLRGIERAGALATEESIDALVNAMEVGSALSRDPEARLVAVRVLAPHAHRPGVRAVLTRELSDPGKGKSAAVTSLADLLRDTAALALARSASRRSGGDDEALQALVGAVRQGGLPGDAASRALVAYPPPSLEGILDGFKKPKPTEEERDASKKDDDSKKGEEKDDKSAAKDKGKEKDKGKDEGKEGAASDAGHPKKPLAPAILTLLGDLGDLRAVSRLRAELKRRDQAGQIAAAIALAKLGDVAPAELARSWIKRPDARLQVSATEVLVRLGTPDAPRAVATLLSSEATRFQGVRYALEAPTPALVKALDAALPKLRPEERPACVEALGRAGDAASAAVLVKLLDQPDLATAAAFALATAAGDPSRDALATAFGKAGDEGDGAKRRLLVRAGVVRALATGDTPSGLASVLEQLGGSKRAADRHVAAFGLVALGERDPADVIGAGDDASIRGAAAGSVARGMDAVAVWSAVLLQDSGALDGVATLSPRATAAGVALLSDDAAALVPTSWLLRRAEEGGALSAPAARALAMRDDEALRPQIERLMEGTDPIVRAHTARGLGASHAPDAASLLVRAYRFEPEAGVRRAIVRGLSARREAQRERALRVARDLDPDPEVRALARTALSGRRLDGVPVTAGVYVGWVDLVANDPSASTMAILRGAAFVRGDGVAVPQVSSDDGVVLVPGLGLGRSSLRLAPAAPSGDASAR